MASCSFPSEAYAANTEELLGIWKYTTQVSSGTEPLIHSEKIIKVFYISNKYLNIGENQKDLWIWQCIFMSCTQAKSYEIEIKA